jgi:hypothetical protein
MHEKIEIDLSTYNNRLKGPNFRIHFNDRLLDRQDNYLEDHYSRTFELDVTEVNNKIVIEHLGKSPKDTIVKKDVVVADVAIRLVDIKFNRVSCHPVDLHENYFYPTNWRYELKDKIKNNLYFGYNGRYEYRFQKPVMKYILSQHEKYKKEDFIIEQIDDISEKKFIEKLKSHIDLEKRFLV